MKQCVDLSNDQWNAPFNTVFLCHDWLTPASQSSVTWMIADSLAWDGGWANCFEQRSIGPKLLLQHTKSGSTQGVCLNIWIPKPTTDPESQSHARLRCTIGARASFKIMPLRPRRSSHDIDQSNTFPVPVNRSSSTQHCYWATPRPSWSTSDF